MLSTSGSACVVGVRLRIAIGEVENAQALVAQAQVLFDHAHEEHKAGTAANLDELRARVQLQAQQQALIMAQNQQAKDLILLKREIGIDPGQALRSPIRRPTANWPRKRRKKCAHWLTRVARTTRTCKTRR